MISRIGTVLEVAGLVIALASIAGAWEYTAQIRPRLEGRNGYRTLPVEDVTEGAWFISQRTRLALGHRVDEKVSLFVQVQDVRTWGEETSTLGDYRADNFDVHQAYADVTPNARWAFRAGRQELAYDGHRIMGTVGWTQQGRSHDAVRVAFTQAEWTAHLVLAHHEADQNTFSSPYLSTVNYRDLLLLWIQHGCESHQASAIILYDSYASPALDRYPERFTLGPRVAGTIGPQNRVFYRAEFYLQTGKTQLFDPPPMIPSPLVTADIEAYLLGLRLGYDFGRIILTGWFDLVSGDDDPFDDTYKAFDTPYPTNHKFYGWADYFLNIPDDTQGLGLRDLALKAKIKRLGPFSGEVHGHYFQLAQENAYGEMNLGWEIDAMLNLPVTEGTNLSFGLSHVGADDALIRLKRGDDALETAKDGNWGWVMLDVNVK